MNGNGSASELHQSDGLTAYQLRTLNRATQEGTLVARTAGGITLFMAAGCEDLMEQLVEDPNIPEQATPAPETSTPPSLRAIEAWQLLVDSDRYRLFENMILERTIVGDQYYEQVVATIHTAKEEVPYSKYTRRN